MGEGCVNVYEGDGGKRRIVDDSKESVGCEKDRRVQFLVS